MRGDEDGLGHAVVDVRERLREKAAVAEVGHVSAQANWQGRGVRGVDTVGPLPEVGCVCRRETGAKRNARTGEHAAELAVHCLCKLQLLRPRGRV